MTLWTRAVGFGPNPPTGNRQPARAGATARVNRRVRERDDAWRRVRVRVSKPVAVTQYVHRAVENGDVADGARIGGPVALPVRDVCSDTPLTGVSDCDDFDDSDFNGALSGQVLYGAGALTLGGELRLLFGEVDGVWLGFNVGTVF